MEYPRDFPADAQARVEGAEIRATADFRDAKKALPASIYGSRSPNAGPLGKRREVGTIRCRTPQEIQSKGPPAHPRSEIFGQARQKVDRTWTKARHGWTTWDSNFLSLPYGRIRSLYDHANAELQN